jgi:hypothetical protein
MGEEILSEKGLEVKDLDHGKLLQVARIEELPDGDSLFAIEAEIRLIVFVSANEREIDVRLITIEIAHTDVGHVVEIDQSVAHSQKHR